MVSVAVYFPAPSGRERQELASGSTAQPWPTPQTSDLGNGSAEHSVGYGEVDELSGLARSGLRPSGQKGCRVDDTTAPDGSRTVSRKKFSSPVGSIPMSVLGNGTTRVASPGAWMT